jgi:hypothetical protein
VSPEPYVRGQALVLAALLVAAAALGSPVAALACAMTSALGAWALRVKYRGDLIVARVDVPRHRERLDLIVAGDARAALSVGLVASGLLVAFDADPPDVGLVPATPVLLAVVAAAVHLSSLFDWYVILPRVSGLLGARPCRRNGGEPARFPKTWRETTKWWYIHRVVAALILRFGLPYAVVLSVGHQLSLSRPASIVIGTAVGISFASYLQVVPRAVWQAGHPTLIVGRTVRRRTVLRTPRTVTVMRRTVRLPWPRRRTVGSLRPPEYVYDVALESVQLAPLRAREDAPPRDRLGNVVYERDPAKVELRDVRACEPEPAEVPFSGCEEHCSGISWYCIENPRCFEPK